jgi:hypothetical protein
MTTKAIMKSPLLTEPRYSLPSANVTYSATNGCPNEFPTACIRTAGQKVPEKLLISPYTNDKAKQVR